MTDGKYSELEILDIMLAPIVLRGMQAAVIEATAMHLFYSSKEWFRSHPGNSLTFSALAALHDSCIVQAAELLKSHPGSLTMPDELAVDREIVQFRIVLSHPYRVKFNQADVQEFFDERKHYGSTRFAPLWHMQCLINKRLASEQRTLRTPDVNVTNEMALLLRDIYWFSMKPEHFGEVPDLPLLLTSTETFKKRLLDFVIEKRSAESVPAG